MEKFILVFALLGSVHLAFLVMSKLGNLMFSFAKPRPNIPDTVRTPDATSMATSKDGEEDWSKYDIPAFIRRGIPMPKLEPVQAKSDAAAFEIVA